MSQEASLARHADESRCRSLEFIHNQLNLPKGDANLEEVLLRRGQLETNHEAGLSLGFRYRFGSIFNNVVNTRFGGVGNRDRF